MSTITRALAKSSKDPIARLKASVGCTAATRGCNERVLKPVPAIGYHDWDSEHTECLKKATCTEPGTMLMHCKRDASHTMTYDYGGTGHVWDEGVITTPPHL